MHDELISLKRLSLRGRDVPFTQAFLVWQRQNRELTWSGLARVTVMEGLPEEGEELSLEATSLDGRAVQGRVLVTPPEGRESSFTFSGIGPLLVDGREL